MKKIVACIVARTWSTRLPLKVLRLVDDEHMLIEFIIKRMKLVDEIDEIFICTSNEPGDEILADIARKNGVQIYQGHPTSVIERMLTVGELTKADYLIRITGDNVFSDYEYLGRQIKASVANDLDYSRLVKVPLGYTTEVIKYTALVRCNSMIDPNESEYMMLYLFNPDVFKCGVLQVSEQDLAGWSLTVDTPEDFARTLFILSHCNSKGVGITLDDVITLAENTDIPHLAYAPQGFISLPKGERMTFAAYLADHEDRIERSYQLTK